MRFLLLFLAFLVVLFVGCSKDFAGMDDVEGLVYQRPEFIETRPEEEVVKVTLMETHAMLLEPPQIIESKGGKYALVIGISDYSGTQNDLKYCDDDARDWIQVLNSKGYTIHSLIDRAATKDAIINEINWLRSMAASGNEIAFIYSGHGAKTKYGSCIITTDLYYITQGWFQTAFTNLGSQKMCFAFDACKIGGMKTALSANGRVIAVASSTTTYSYDGDASMQNGVWTYYFIAAFTSQGMIYYEPAAQYACDGMINWATIHHLKVAPSYLDKYAGNLQL